METIKLNIILENNWLEATWLEDEIQLHCESFSGNKEHITLLRTKAKEFNTSLEEFEPLIKQCQNAFIYPTDEEIEYEKRRQFEIQFRFDRDSLLNKTDIEINKAEDIGQDTKDLRAYRQALRDSAKDWIMPEEIF